MFIILERLVLKQVLEVQELLQEVLAALALMEAVEEA